MNNGIISVESANDFETTYSKLKGALEANPNTVIVKEFNHKENAQSVGLDLNRAQVIFFGNPKLGTPLMARSITTALDLPQKILVFEEDGVAYVAYNDPMYLQRRHNILEADPVLNKIAGALKKLVELITAK